ncbi:DUF2778 domain-containing protein [Pseudomonas knackmussii]|uniref:DUF2778 domain-containing protein n=1 Tax=Pseudomonas knackmussii TaxID=65741 RepID=UPI0013646611|nr:DUF2778 domain-containing protein [Pseudomonas knackmussii]
MIRCTFHLNGGALSILSCPGVGFFPAYSGNAGPHRNNPASISIKTVGPIPPGNYYIVDRPRGGRLGWLHDSVHTTASGSDRDLWFALYREDACIDDHTWVGDIERGEFRLHPAGRSGVSEGCITLPNHNQFKLLRDALLVTARRLVGVNLFAYGEVRVY